MTDNGFVKAQSDNLPKIDAFMMRTYFASNPDFTSAEVKGVKAARSQRESYGDSAVGYVQIKREGNLCVVKARITPEHNVRQKSYAVQAICDEAEETVISVECLDCAAHLGSQVIENDAGCVVENPMEVEFVSIDGEVKELIKYEHSYAAPRSSNGVLQKEDTIIIVDDTSLNTYENGVDTTQVVLTKLIESYNIEETCYSDADQLLSHLDIAEVTEIASTAENKENIATQNQNEIRKTLQKSENISNPNLSSCDDLLLEKEECQNINTKNLVNTATTKYPENIIKTGQMQHGLDDSNVNKVNISSAGFKRKRNLIESYNIEETCYSDADQLLGHLDIAEVTEIANIAENKENIASQDQNEIRKTLHKSEDISDCNLSSCNDLSSDKEECQNINTKNSVSTATTKYTENIKTGQIHHVLDDANANKVNKCCSGFRRNRKYLYYPIQPKSGRSEDLRKNRSIKAYICFDKYYVSKESQANLNQIKPLLINSMSSFNTQSNSPYKQSVSFDFALFKYRDKVLNASLLLNLENKDHNSLKFGGYNANDLHQSGGKHSLQQSGCNTHVNSIGEESVREICEQANPESRSIPNDELCLSDNYTQNNAIIQDSLSTNDRHIISESKSIPNDELCLSNIHTLDNRIQRLLCKSPDRHVSVRIYEENCVNPAGPVSPKPAKLYVSELDVDVGSTTFVSGGFEPNDDEPVEDPLAIHSPDLGIKDSMCSVENIMNVVEENKSNIEDNMSDIEDNMSNVEDNMSTVEDNLSNVEDNMSNVEDNMSTVKDKLSNVEDNVSNVEDNMSTVEDNIMSTVEDNLSNVEDNMSTLEDNMSNVEDNMSTVEDNIMSTVEDNLSNVEDNISNVEDNMSTLEDNTSNIEDNISTVEDNMSNVEDNMSNVEDNMSNVDDNMSTVEDSISTKKDNMSFKKDNRHLVDSINPDSCINNVIDREYDDLDLRLEIAYALKFKYQEGKTSKKAVEEIIEKYGRGKLSLEEAKCWYNEFNLGNSIMRIIFSGGPIYK